MAKILITGQPGVGKTTFILNVYKKLDLICGGFYTKEIRKMGTRVGFDIFTLDGKTAPLASVNHKSAYRVSKYGVYVENVDNVAVPAILEAVRTCDLVIIDEIGKMELFSEEFKKAVLTAFNSPKSVLASVKQVEDEFTKKLLSRPDVILFKLTFQNREQTIGEVIKLLEKI
jgi:nucleoside-triphosphatase